MIQPQGVVPARWNIRRKLLVLIPSAVAISSSRRSGSRIFAFKAHHDLRKRLIRFVR